MTFASLVLEIRRRAAQLRWQRTPPDVALGQAVSELLKGSAGTENDVARQILAALVALAKAPILTLPCSIA